MCTRTIRAFIVASCALTPASAIQIAEMDDRAPHIEAVEALSFSDFVTKFFRSYKVGTSEWASRESVFNESKRQVLKFLKGPPQSWTMGITQFADYTAPEYKAILGRKGRRGSKTSEDGAAFSNARMGMHPAEFSVQKEASLTDLVRDQGSCGSCWAQAAVASLESQMEVNKTIMRHLRKALSGMGKNLSEQLATLSSQTMVSCTKNPKNCGGSGGCDGAIVELAYDMVKERGIALAPEWPYESGFSGTVPCKEEVFKKASVGITGYVVLPSNKVNPLRQALYETGGAIAVSVDASNWAMYDRGIFTDTERGSLSAKGDFTVNHAVTLVAYQMPKAKKQGYWLIKNSWGVHWGEDGFIRLEMKENEEDHCGMDHDTHMGLACDGDPDEAWVCGTCGVLYDSVYATGVHLL